MTLGRTLRCPMQFDDDVVIIGDGPTGLTAALYLAKNGMGAHVLGDDKSPMHKALLYNQPGLPGATGSHVLHVTRQQVIDLGGHIHIQHAIGVQRVGQRYHVNTQKGDVFTGKYVVLAGGRNRHLAELLGVHIEDRAVKIDIHGRTSQENVYAGGNMARGVTQAVISMGDGAAIALDILSQEKGAPFHDYDVVTTHQPQHA